MSARVPNEATTTEWGSEGDGGIYVWPMMLAGTIDLIGFVALYRLCSWWLS